MNERRCIDCKNVIKPSAHEARKSGSWEESIILGAWLAGFCSVDCLRNNARSVVDNGRAWWQNKEGKDGL